jgi:16S rRNA (uracil1498-N3)-methyltransferase
MAHKLFRLYIANPISVNQLVVLDKKQSHYLKNVLRLKSGFQVIIFNENDGEFLAEMNSEGKHDATLNPLEKLREPDSIPPLTLLFAPVKNARSEFIVEKATELGVAEIQPMITEFTVVRKVNTERMQATAIEATEQSERITPPIIHAEEDFKTIITRISNTHKIMFCDESGNGTKMNKAFADEKNAAAENTKWAILIGPEGGFSPAEREALYNLQKQKPESIFPVSLGARILRADTAAIAAITLWQNYLGDLN